MTIPLIEESELKKEKKTIKIIDECITDEKILDIKNTENIAKPLAGKKELKLLSKEDIISCERIKKGILCNCVVCENLDHDVFIACKNKYPGIV